ncbi:MAG: hypothetical protein WBP81_20415 [Solirubrobacteraceae bacterium]
MPAEATGDDDDGAVEGAEVTVAPEDEGELAAVAVAAVAAAGAATADVVTAGATSLAVDTT